MAVHCTGIFEYKYNFVPIKGDSSNTKNDTLLYCNIIAYKCLTFINTQNEISIIINPFSACDINGHKLTGLSTITKEMALYGGSIVRAYSPQIKPRV